METNYEVTDEEMAKDFAYEVVEVYEDDTRSLAGEWADDSGRWIDLIIKKGDSLDDYYEEDVKVMEGWTYHYHHSAVFDCGAEWCNRPDCCLNPVGYITITTDKGVKYQFHYSDEGLEKCRL